MMKYQSLSEIFLGDKKMVSGRPNLKRTRKECLKLIAQSIFRQWLDKRCDEAKKSKLYCSSALLLALYE